MLVSKNIPGSFSGVSQAVPELRQISQVSEMINCYSTVGYGTTARPKLTKKITFPFTIINNFSEIVQHEVNNEIVDFLYIINSDTLYIYNLNDYSYTTLIDTYFNGINNKNGKLVKSGNKVYILNTKITISENTGKNSDSLTQYSKFIHIKAGVRPGNYTITDGTNECKATILVETNGNSTTLTDDICECLYTGSNIGDFIYSGYAGGLSSMISGLEERNGSVIYYPNTTDLSNISSNDSMGNLAIAIIDKQSTTLGELPPLKHNLTIKVTGSDNTDNSNIYYEFNNNSWKESYKKTYIGDTEIYRSFNNTDMPRIIKNENGIFTLNLMEIKDREIGDNETNPMPLFLDTTINDIFIYQNRLCFLSDKGITFSEIGDFSNFFRNTTRTLLNYDSFNFEIEINEGISLKNAVSYSNNVILFNNNSQYILNVIGSNDIRITKATNYKSNDKIKPKVINDKLYFVNNKSNFSNIYEYTTKERLDLTSNVPNYVNSDLTFISSVNLYDILLMGNGNNEVFVSNNGSISKWIFGNSIKNIHSGNNKDLFFLSQNCLYLMNLDNLGGSDLFGNIDNNLIDDTDNGTYTYSVEVVLSKYYIPTDLQGVTKPSGNYRLKRLNLGSNSNLKVTITDINGVVVIDEIVDNMIDLQYDLKTTEIKFSAKNVGFFYTSFSIDLLYTDSSIDKI